MTFIYRWQAVALFLSALSGLWPGTRLSAQVTGSIGGSVLDESGSAVASAAVRLVSESTGVERKTVCDVQGAFLFNAVAPGLYTLLVEHPGFRKRERAGIELGAGERVAAGEIRLEIGAASESVTVTDRVATIQSASSERSGTVTSSEVSNLTVINRDFASLASLLPGVVETTGTEVPGFNAASSFNVMGSRNTDNSITIDGQGTENMNFTNRNTNISMDAVSTVRILVSNFQAEFGRKPGASIQAVTKSGGREFHGSAYYYKRHEMFNAASFFNNRNGIAQPPYRLTQAGYTIGGPVFIPGFFNNARDKLFVFMSGEWLREARPQNILQYSMPTALERSGDFTRTTDLTGKQTPITDPLAHAAFPGNIVPASRINPSGRNYLNLFPLPNFFDLGISGRRYNYQTQESLRVPKNTETVRVDYNAGPSTVLYGRLTYWSETTLGYSVPAGTVAWPFMKASFHNVSSNYLLSATRILNPTLILEATASLGNYHETSAGQSAEDLQRITRKSIGFTVPQFHPEFNPYDLVPRATFGGVTNPPTVNYDDRFPYNGAELTPNVTATVTSTHGGHVSKAGVMMSHWRVRKGQFGVFSGSYAFARDTTNPNDSNYAYSNAVLGNFQTYTESSARPAMTMWQTAMEPFLQDNWKVTRRLTLDLGLRFGWSQPWHVPGNAEEAAFVPERWNPAKQVALLMPVMVSGQRMARHPLTGALYPAAAIGAIAEGTGDPFNGTVTHALEPDYPRGMRNASSLKAAPRVGFAFDPFGRGRTVLRGGAGLFFDVQEMLRNAYSVYSNPPIRLDPVVYYGSMDTLGSLNSFSFPTATMGFNRERPLGRTMNFSFGVQQQLKWGVTADVAYAGSLGRHLVQARNRNAIPFGTTFLPSSIDPTTNRAYATGFLYPYQGYTTITQYLYDGNSSYHSLQASAGRRLARGVQFTAAWTWSKAMDYADLDNVLVSTLVDRRIWNYGKAGFDRTHIVKVSFIWDLPKLSRLWRHEVVRQLFDGWQVSGIGSLVSGAPLGVTFTQTGTTNITGSPTDGARVVVIADPRLPRGERTFSRNFNTEAFAPPQVGTIGNAAKDLFRGPGINNWDTSMFKTFAVHGERWKMQIRMETYNTFNHTQFSGLDAAAQFDARGQQINARFGEFTAARQPRRMQLALRLNW